MGWRPVDVVACILAVGLSSAVVLILIATTLQITKSSFPQVELSANASWDTDRCVWGVERAARWLPRPQHQEKGGTVQAQGT